ncbi:hypothetical protein [Erwinia sp.]|uniref:hypothetical protein n=1 Tax=Erwinia citreus TaxID=558 RepID=UPI003C77B67C
MNNRTLFYLSLIVIFIGLAGIFLQNRSRDIPLQNQRIPELSAVRKTIFVAKSTRELHAHEILSPADYKITEVEVEEESQTITETPELPPTSLKGYLILHSVAEGSTLLPEMLESPLSATFVKNSLKKNELPYSIKLKSDDAWLLNFLSVGDDVVLYLRIAEHKNTRLTRSSEGHDSSPISDSERSGSTLTRFLGPLTIISFSTLPEKRFNSDETVGEVIVRLTQDQMKKIRVVEKYAEILMSPASNEDDFDNSKLSLNEVLPQLTPLLPVRELRGNK